MEWVSIPGCSDEPSLPAFGDQAAFAALLGDTAEIRRDNQMPSLAERVPYQAQLLQIGWGEADIPEALLDFRPFHLMHAAEASGIGIRSLMEDSNNHQRMLVAP